MKIHEKYLNIGNINGILQNIIKRKIDELNDIYSENHMKKFNSDISKRTDYRDFRNAVLSQSRYDIRLIAEYKKASPSKGIINNQVSIEEQLRKYESGGARAVSILTETNFFKGSLSYIADAKIATKLPVLRKDFIFTEYQVLESASSGADAILLIGSILNDEGLPKLLSLAESLDLDVITEVHSKDEIERAINAGAEIIGINNRNLKTFNVDINTSVNLSGMIPAGTVAVSESGINDRNDIIKLADSNIFAFLIGESLMRADKPDELLRNLIGEKQDPR